MSVIFRNKLKVVYFYNVESVNQLQTSFNHAFSDQTCLITIFVHTQTYSEFGDIMKETMSRTRQVNKMESARTLVLCLQQVNIVQRSASRSHQFAHVLMCFSPPPQLFVALRQEQESSSRAQPGVQTFSSIKELARRFALTFGDAVKFRECVVMIHRSAAAALIVFQRDSHPAGFNLFQQIRSQNIQLFQDDPDMTFSVDAALAF